MKKVRFYKRINTEKGIVLINFSVKGNKPVFEFILPKNMRGEYISIFKQEYENVIKKFKMQCIDEMQRNR